MFHDSAYMGGMHGWWWLFWFMAMVVTLIVVWKRPGWRRDVRGDVLQEQPHALLRRRLASGAITPQQYEEHKTLLDRDRDH